MLRAPLRLPWWIGDPWPWVCASFPWLRVSLRLGTSSLKRFEASKSLA